MSENIVWRDDEGYEEARRRVLWNKWTPDRFPDAIVRVESDQGVVEAIELARSRGLKVAVKGGGHSFCGSPLRDGGVLIDLSGLKGVVVDAEAGTATVQPGVTGREFARTLADHDLAFPVGHCGSVPMSGYLLAGGLGWNMGSWGPATFSVKSLDVVTAEAALVSAGPEQNADLYWAARGSGAGFFGVATRFQLGVYPLPRSIRSSTHVFPVAHLDALTRWATGIAPVLPPTLEMLIFIASPPPGVVPDPNAKVVGITAAAFADSEAEATEQLSMLDGDPIVSDAVHSEANQPSSFDALLDVLDQVLPANRRYAADAFWSNDDLLTLLPGLAEQIQRAPSPESTILAPIIPPPPQGAGMPDAAFSMVGRSLLLCYAIWRDAADDATNFEWFRALQSSLDPHATGFYVGEADLSASPSKSRQSVAPPNWERLEQLRGALDPGGLFHSYLGQE